MLRLRRAAFSLWKRCFSARVEKVTNTQVLLTRFAQPSENVEIRREELQFDPQSPEHSNKLFLRTRVATINPGDVNIMQGVYGALPELPSVVGNEGLLEIVNRGKDVPNEKYRFGEFVVPRAFNIGTFQQYLIADPQAVTPLYLSSSQLYRSTLQFQLAQLYVNPPTAFRLLSDYMEDPKPGDTVIQSAANSAVGECVIQIARKFGFRTVNIIRGSVNGSESRSKEEFLKIRDRLAELGADVVIGDEDLSSMSRQDIENLDPKPRLALNAVGGPVVRTMARTLADKGVIVTFGGMSRQPITLPTAPFIFQGLTSTGFWMSRWKEEAEKDEAQCKEYDRMMIYLRNMVMNGELKVSTRPRRFGSNGEGFQSALRCAMGLEPLPGDESFALTANDLKKLMGTDSDPDPFVRQDSGKVVVVFDA